MSKFEIELGSTVVSNVTGFKGIVTARAEHLNSCMRYWVQPKVDKDGKAPDGSWIDEGELLLKKVPTLKPTNQNRGGFPSKVK